MRLGYLKLLNKHTAVTALSSISDAGPPKLMLTTEERFDLLASLITKLSPERLSNTVSAIHWKENSTNTLDNEVFLDGQGVRPGTEVKCIIYPLSGKTFTAMRLAFFATPN